MKVVNNDILQEGKRKERGLVSAVLLSQVLSVIHLESLGHLHQIQVYLQLAELMPVTIDRNL